MLIINMRWLTVILLLVLASGCSGPPEPPVATVTVTTSTSSTIKGLLFTVPTMATIPKGKGATNATSIIESEIFSDSNPIVRPRCNPLMQDNTGLHPPRIIQVASSIPEDADGDGVYDSLIVNVEVEADEDGSYMLSGLLTGGEKQLVSDYGVRSLPDSGELYSLPLNLTAGMAVVSLNFSGEDISMAGYDGEYDVNLTLCGKGETGYYTETSYLPIGSYAHDEFERPPARISDVWEFMRDQDSDGLYDYMYADLEMEVWNPGRYLLSGYLDYVDPETGVLKDSFVSYQVDKYLIEGGNTERLVFEGSQIYKARVNGEMILNIELRRVEDGQHVEFKSLKMPYRNYKQFRRPMIEFTSYDYDYTTDVDGDGILDSIVFMIGLSTREDANYTFSGWLVSNESRRICSNKTTVFLEKNTQSVNLSFSGTAINSMGFDGPYYVEDLTVMADNLLIDSAKIRYKTLPYGHHDFEEGSDLSGFILDEDGKPIEYARVGVSTSAEYYTTGPKGFYNIRNLPDGEHTLVVLVKDGVLSPITKESYLVDGSMINTLNVTVKRALNAS
ncbi:MAG: carboxypeptidase-like regulatory domain-containing protein [Candidatus Altiarchaeota archaeon]